MALWDSIVSAIGNLFSAPKVQSAWPSAPKPYYPSSQGAQVSSTPNYTQQIVKQNYPAPATPRPRIEPTGIAVQGPTYTAPGGGGSRVPSTTTAQPPIIPPTYPELPASNIQNAIKNIAKQIASVPAVQSLSPEIGKAGKALTKVGTTLKAPQIIPGGLGAAAQGWAGFNQGVGDVMRASKEKGLVPNVDAAMQEFARNANYYKDQLQQGNINTTDIWSQALSRAMNPMQAIFSNPSLWQRLLQQQTPVPPAPSGQILPSAASTAQGQILPSAAKTGAPVAASQGVIPSPLGGGRSAPIPSAVSNANLPANFQGLTRANVNPAVAQNITPEAIQAIGQLLLRGLLTNQSALTGLSPGLAQALWGAPTASSAFGGYAEGGSAVPEQERIKQPTNLPPTPIPLNVG